MSEVNDPDIIVEKEKDHCKICRDEGTEEEPLFTPCKCIGSIGKIHEQCLYNWIIQKLNIRDIDSYIKMDPTTNRYHLLKNIDIKCDICRSPYSFKTVYKSDNIKNIPWADFIKPLVKKTKNVLKFTSLVVLVIFVIFIVVPNYWMFLRCKLEALIDSFFSFNFFQKSPSIKTNTIKFSADMGNLPLVKENTSFKWSSFFKNIIFNSYSGLLDIIFVGLVTISIYFSQDLINSEYIFKEMLIQKMGPIDAIDLTKIYSSNFKKVLKRTQKYLEDDTSPLLVRDLYDDIAYSSLMIFNKVYTLAMVKPLLQKTLLGAFTDVTTSMSHDVYMVNEDSFNEHLQKFKMLAAKRLHLTAVALEIKNMLYPSNDDTLVQDNETDEAASRLLKKNVLKPAIYLDYPDVTANSFYARVKQMGINEASSLEADLKIIDRYFKEQGNADPRFKLFDGDLPINTSFTQNLNQFVNNGGEPADEAPERHDDNIANPAPPAFELDGNNGNELDQELDRLQNEFIRRMNNRDQGLVAEEQENEVEEANQPNGFQGDGLNIIAIQFSFKNLPKYCLYACLAATVLLFLVFSLPYCLGKVVLSIVNRILSLILINKWINSNYYTNLFLTSIKDTINFENHLTLKRVVPCCIFYFLAMGILIMYQGTLEKVKKPYKYMPLANRPYFKILFHIQQLLKTYIIISIELLIFPIISGMMIDFSFIAPLILSPGDGIKDMKFLAVHESLNFLPYFVQIIIHAAMGTIYMLSIASFIGMIRGNILRNGVLYFVRSPEDPNRKILSDCLTTSFRLQIKKLFQSMVIYMAFIFGGFGIPTRVILPMLFDSYKKKAPLVTFFIFKDITKFSEFSLMKINLSAVSIALLYKIFYTYKPVASKDLRKIWADFFEIACKRLRLSHYILNVSSIDERGQIIYRNLYYKYLSPDAAQFSNEELYTEPKSSKKECYQLFKENPNIHCYFIPDGNFYRVPGSDILSTKFIRTLFSVVTKNDKIIHNNDVRPKLGYRGEFDNLIRESETFDKYDVIYCPPNFMYRSLALLVEVNVFAIFFIIAGVLLSSTMGQSVVSIITNTIYTSSLEESYKIVPYFNKNGVYFEFVCLGFTLLLHTIYKKPSVFRIPIEDMGIFYHGSKSSSDDMRTTQSKGILQILKTTVIIPIIFYTALSIIVVQPINYIIYMITGDQTGFNKILSSLTLWFFLKLYYMLQPHSISFVSEENEEVLLVKSAASSTVLEPITAENLNEDIEENSEEESDSSNTPATKTFDNRVLENVYIHSLLTQYAYRKSLLKKYTCEIIAVSTQLNVAIIIQTTNNLIKQYFKLLFMNRYAAIFGIVAFVCAMVIRLSSKVRKLRKDYESEILFESRVLQNAQD